MKWTQEQRDAAEKYVVWEIPDGGKWKDIAIELACQRNALLDALKNVADKHVNRVPCWCTVPNGHEIISHESWCVEARAAIAKAESL